MNTLRIAAASIAVLLLTHTPLYARGKCDGIHGCLCGVTQAHHFGFPRVYNGFNLARARTWVEAFPRTVAQVGAVMWRHGLGPSGHVARIVSLDGGCNATVADERGQHPDNICNRGATFVMPGSQTNPIQMSARSKRGKQVASIQPEIVDRLSVH